MTQSLREVRHEHNRMLNRLHMAGGMVLAALGLLMIATGALVPFGIVTICIGVAYAVASYIFGLVQQRFEDRLPEPRPEELDSYAHH